MTKKNNTYEEARLALNELPGTHYYKTLEDNIVAFVWRPSTRRYNHWSLYEVSYEQALEAVAKGAKALTHDEAYEELLEGSFDRESYMLMALDLAEDKRYALEEVLSVYNTETGSAWVSCDENSPYWAEEEESGKHLVHTSDGFEIR